MQTYLPALREFHNKNKITQPSTVKKGKVVIIHDEGPRKQWKMGVIEGIITSNDGEIRAVHLRTANGTTNRPIAKLYPLGLQEELAENQSTDTGSAEVINERPKRHAAEKAKLLIK